MRVRDFVAACPASAELFATPNCSASVAIAKMFSLYSGHNPGSGYHQQHPVAKWRTLVAYRLIVIAMTELFFTKVGLGASAWRDLERRLADEMPKELVINSDIAEVRVRVDDEIRFELNNLDLLAVS